MKRPLNKGCRVAAKGRYVKKFSTYATWGFASSYQTPVSTAREGTVLVRISSDSNDGENM